MLFQYLFGVVVTSLLGFLLLVRLRDKKQNKQGNAGVSDVITPTSANSRGSADIIVVGAGVAGSALAYTLGKAGRRVHVIERDLTEPHRIVGELLQPGGYLKLVELGLEDCVEEIDAQRIIGYTLYRDGHYTKLPYPLEKYDSQVAGRSFHNGRFIQKMREKASSLPNVRMEEGTVTSLFEEKGVVKGVLYKSKTGEHLQASAPLTIVCDGCFSNLRRALCSSKVEVPSSFVGLILENCKLPFSNNGHVILADPSPILFYPISSTEVRCLVDLPGQEVPSIAKGEMARYLKTLVAPQIPSILRDAFIAAVDKGNIKTMPNRSMPANPLPTPGALLLGDAFNMRHPLTGGGMTVALSDIVVLQNLLEPLHDLHDASSLCKYLESFYTLRKPVASTINTLAGALYKVFSSSPDQARNEMRQACFDYLSLGGTCSTGPVALLSGLNPRPLTLVAHFFAVAVFGVGRLLLPFPSPKRMWIGARLIAAGRRVHVIERDLTEPHGIVGEFLQPGGYLKLVELDLEDCVEEIDAQRIDKYILLKDGQYSDLPFPLEKYDSQVAGRGFHNGRFVQRLREKASSLPNVCMEEGTVTSLFEEKGVVKGVFYRSKYVDQLQARAPLTIVCDGCFSNLRRALCSSKVKVPSSFAGLILENYKLPFSNSGVLILANPSPILFYPISSTEVRCLVDLPGQELPSIATGEMSNYLKFLVLPEIPTELHDAFIAAVDKGKIRTMPSRSMLANPIPTPGAFLLGDAFNMRHPLTGGGMTVALSDVAVLQKLLEPLHDLHDASYICKKLEAFYTLRKPVASPINILADLMHTVFSSLPGQARSEIEQSYVDYLRLGGTCSTGLMGLISGLNPSPWSLVAHFISVTVFGVGRLMLPFPSPKRMWIAARLIASACGLIFPIMKAEGVRQMFFPATVPAYYRAPPGQ